ncbi:MAG: adenylate/guanylate cyclase domain-containing protein [Lapillicoccus sp.]
MSEISPAGAGRHGEISAIGDLEEVTATLLGHPLDLTRRDVSAAAKVSQRSARSFWQALGFPLVNTDEALFTQADVDALQVVAGLVRDGDLDESTALQLTRAFARTADRLASWQVQLVAEAVEAERDRVADVNADHSSAATAQATARFLVRVADDLEPLLLYAWRRHLADAVSRLLTDAEPETAQEGIYRHIGFADLVAFSTMVRKSTERELAVIVQRFEGLCADIVTAHGGRIVKTVGDEILFSNRHAGPAAATALDLDEAIARDPVLPDVRVGLAAGRVIPRLGDVFGTTVNRAARLTSIAQPHTVLVDGAVAEALKDISGFDLTALRPRAMRGVGKVEPYLLVRAGTAVRPRTRPSPPTRQEPA